jgi:hypothetical protein
VPEVTYGSECGVGLEGFSGLEAGDEVECFVVVSVKQEL